jgi:opacity protein-like surface antigen
MTKTIRVCVLFLAFGLLGGMAFGQSRRPSLFAQGGGAFHEENNLRPGVETGFGFSYPLGKRLSLSLEYLYWKSESKEFRTKLYNGTLTLSPVLLSLQFDFLRNTFFFPYAFVGGGYLFSRFRIGSYVSIPEVKIDQRVADGPAFYFGLGARIAFSETWSFLSEAAYLVRNATGETIISDMNKGISTEKIWVNIHVVFLKFGVRFYF